MSGIGVTLLSLLAAMLLLKDCETAKILLVPTAADNSHVYTLRKVYDEATLRGHDATFVILASDAPRLSARDSGSNLSYITHKDPSADLTNLSAVVLDNADGGLKPLFRTLMSLWHSSCDALLSDADTMATLKAGKYDLVVGIGLYVCTPVLSAALDVPHVEIHANGPLPYSLHSLWRGDGLQLFQPLRISYVAETEARLMHPMSFMGRLYNAYMYLDYTLYMYNDIRPFTLQLSAKHGIDLRTPEARRRRIMTLYSGHFALEQTRPLTPDSKLVGPIMALPAKPLPVDLERFVARAGSRGVVVVSMGTHAQLGAKAVHATAAALGKLPAYSVWKLSEAELASAGTLGPLNLSSNVKILTWLPQNDLLGHASVRAFLSHCGSNGMYEAAYHGVPIVCMPNFADQIMNTMKVLNKGLGLAVFRHEVTEGSVHKALRRVLTEGSFSAAAKRISKQIRSTKRTALQEAVDWVEHALETDSVPYLHTPDEELSWLVLHSADVAAFALALLLAAGATLFFCMQATLLGLQPYMSDKLKQV